MAPKRKAKKTTKKKSQVKSKKKVMTKKSKVAKKRPGGTLEDQLFRRAKKEGGVPTLL